MGIKEKLLEAGDCVGATHGISHHCVHHSTLANMQQNATDSQLQGSGFCYMETNQGSECHRGTEKQSCKKNTRSTASFSRYWSVDLVLTWCFAEVTIQATQRCELILLNVLPGMFCSSGRFVMTTTFSGYFERERERESTRKGNSCASQHPT